MLKDRLSRVEKRLKYCLIFYFSFEFSLCIMIWQTEFLPSEFRICLQQNTIIYYLHVLELLSLSVFLIFVSELRYYVMECFRYLMSYYLY